MTLALLTGELSNPFNILRKRYELEGQTIKARTMGATFCIVFLVMRIGLVPYLVRLTQYSNEPLVFKLFCGSMFFISLVWSMMILNHFSKGLSDVKLNNLLYFNFLVPP